MIAVPVVSPWARPPEEIVAAVVPLVVHVTELVRSCVVPSVNVPVAENCWVSPRAIEGLAGITAMEAKAATETVAPVELVIAPEAA